MEDQLFRDVALRAHILFYVEPDPADDDRMEHWTVTPFNRAGEPCGEPLAVAMFSFGDDDLDGWIKRTPVIYSEAELPERIKHLDIYGRASDEERAQAKAESDKRMLEFERELILCTAPDDVMH
jgi:hypothetical protein